MAIWVLVVYMLNPKPAVIAPGQDPHVIQQTEFKTQALCLQAKQKVEHEDEQRGAKNDFSYKCVRRTVGGGE